MDPQANLKEQLELSTKIIALNDEFDASGEELMTGSDVEELIEWSLRLAELSQAYCEWVTRGGFVSGQ